MKKHTKNLIFILFFAIIFSLLNTHPAFASITRVHVPASAVPCSKGTNGSTALTCSTDVPPTIGDSLIVYVEAGGSGSSTTVTDNATGGSNTYTEQIAPAGLTSPRQYSAPIVRTNAGTFTVTVTPSGAATLDVWFAEYAGVDTTQVDDTASGGTGASGVRQCGSTDALTTTNANDLIIATLTAGGATPLTVDAANSTYTMSALYTPFAFGYGGIMDKIESSTVSGLNLLFDGATGLSSQCAVVAYKAATGLTVPGAPTGATATAGNTQATVTFTAPASNGGASIDGYTVTSIPAGGTDSNAGTTGLSHVVTGLTNGTSYTFTVTAHNSVGNSSASSASNAVTPNAPATTYTFTGPSSGNVNAASTNFTVTPDGAYTGTITITPSGAGVGSLTPTVLTFSNSAVAQTFTITPNATGSITMTGTNNGGLTNPSTVTYTSNAAANTYTFTGPSSGNVNSASTNFTVTPVGGVYTGTITLTPTGGFGLSATVLTFNNSSSAQTFTITPTNGGSITLTGTNNHTLTNPSNLTYTANPVVPGAPTGATATGGNAQATVTFTAPASNGGAAIDGYTVTSIPSGGTDSNAGTTGLSHVVTGLTNGTSYTFTVTAHNSVGNSAASGASNAVTPNPPAAITRVHVPASAVPCSKGTNGSTALTCSTDVPPTIGDSLIVYVEAGGSGSSTTVTDNATGGSNTYTEQIAPAGLNSPRQYSAPIVRTNAGTFTVTVTPSGAATLDVWFAEYAGVDTTQVDDTASGGTGASGVRQCGSTDALTTTNANDLIIATLTAGGATPLTVDAANSTYTMSALYTPFAFGYGGIMDKIASSTVSGLNLLFDGATGLSSQCAVVAYKAATATPATTFTFTGPSSGNVNAASTNFTVTPDGAYTGTITITPSGAGVGSLTPTVLTFNNSNTPQTFTITPNAVGSITLTPTNNGGLTSPSNLTYISNPTVPGAPTGATATGGNAQATITFTAPASNGGATITGYTVTSIPAGGTDSNAGTTGLSHVITGLTNGTSYTFTVKATNSAGQSAASSASNPVTPATVPGAPTGATATGGNAQATVTFTAPASNGGASITGYTVTSIPAGGTDSNAGSTGLSHVVTGLTNGTSYTFTVHATNSAGNSSESSASNAVTPNPPAATSYTFTGPSSGNVNSASTNFTVTPVGGNYTGTITLTPTGGFGLSATVLTFSNSSAAQTFTITPTNGGSITLTPTNNGSLTNPSNLTYTANAVVPGAPTGATATGGNAQATVTFTAPASNGGATITGYTVTSIPAGGTDSNASSTSLSHIVTGLTNGTSYTFTVKASNSAGQSAASSASNAVTPSSSTHSLSGTIKYYDGIKLVPSATVTLEDGSSNPITSTTTDVNGVYSFSNVADGGNYIVVASKTDGNGAENSADQIKIGRHIVGLETFDTIYKNISADVNNDGTLSSADQIKIGRNIVGLDVNLPSGAWKFYASNVTPTTGNYLFTGLSRTYTNLTADQTNQDFVGIKMGDTNNSW